MRDRVYSLETEYAVLHRAENGPSRRDLSPVINALCTVLKERCGLSSGSYLTNGSRFYHDQGHAEWSLPECRSPREAVLYDKAADSALRAVIGHVQDDMRESGMRGTLAIIKNNADSRGNTYGCHENYMAQRNTNWLGPEDHWRLTATSLIPFLVTRQILCGSGRVGWGTRGQEGTNFQMMQRADFIQRTVSNSTTEHRAIVGLSRETEPFASGPYRRLHLILADANLCGWACWMKLGTTGIILRMLEDAWVGDIPHLADPVEALRRVSRDPTCTATIPLGRGGETTALEIQREYQRQAADYLQVHGASDEEKAILQEWEGGLEQVAKDPGRLFGKVDWVTKKALMDRYLQKRGLDWSDLPAEKEARYALMRMDIEYHDVSSERGLFRRLEEAGNTQCIATDAEIAKARSEPPPLTRAINRGLIVSSLRTKTRGEVTNWDRAVIGGLSVHLTDPLDFFDGSIFGMMFPLREVRESLAAADGIVYLDLAEWTPDTMSAARRRARDVGLPFLVMTSESMVRAVGDGFFDTSSELLDRLPVAAVWEGEITELARQSVKLADQLSNAQIRGAAHRDEVFTSNDVRLISTLPPRKQFIGQILHAILSPATELVSALTQPAVELQGQIQTLANQTAGSLRRDRDFARSISLAEDVPTPKKTKDQPAQFPEPADEQSAGAMLANLRQAAASTEPAVRRRAVRAVGEAQDTSCFELLRSVAATDEDRDVRIAAVESIAALGGARAEETLLEFIKDKDLVVRWKVFEVLIRLPSEKPPPGERRNFTYTDEPLVRFLS